MNVGYRFAEIVIVVEFSLVAIIILATYLLKFFYSLRARRRAKITADVDHFLTEKISKKRAFKSKDFLNKWKKIDILIPVINKFDKNVNSAAWHDLRLTLVHSVILPLARKAAMKKNWVMRFFAAEAFRLANEIDDEKYIVKLSKDSIPLVYLNALSAALKSKSKSALDVIITRMSDERGLTQSTYLQAFDNASATTRSMIEQHLQSTNEPYTRATCYKILLKYSAEKINWNIKSDIESSNLELRLAALRFLAHNEGKSSIPTLRHHLKDQQWEVRIAAIHCLGDLHAIEAISEIALCLRDPEWWVRINAGQALKNLGKEGIEVLKAQDPNVDKFAFETAQHVLAVK